MAAGGSTTVVNTILVSLGCYLVLLARPCHQKSTLLQEQKFDGGEDGQVELFSSENWIFKLQFDYVSPLGNFSNLYLGIWYNLRPPPFPFSDNTVVEILRAPIFDRAEIAVQDNDFNLDGRQRTRRDDCIGRGIEEHDPDPSRNSDMLGGSGLNPEPASSSYYNSNPRPPPPPLSPP
ncbi:unnamed protein product [Linum trigynum]|uniref:Uncharacterized protein n=1 Tax=Linum trigynum TaxID=586398 RepID=A0AAV2EIH0_9ROSI